MHHIGKRWLAVLACLLCLAGFSGPAALAAEKPEYLTSVTYFGDQWPINFWSSEDDNMDQNFAQIAADGFNSIILVVPWKEFQPTTMPTTYNSYAFDKLNRIFESAEAHGLWVTMRIGYTWDYYESNELPKRFSGVLNKDGADYPAWIEYSKTLYEAASAHPNFYGGFITWEDFWDFTYVLSRDINKTARARQAKECGYLDYLQEHYTLEEVSDRYGKEFESFDEVYLPLGSHPSASLLYEFYDQFLVGLLQETQQVFPGLSMEVRADGDVIYDTEGSYSYYSHASTYSCPGADYTALMYSVSMGQQNNHERISAEQALAAMNNNLAHIYEKSGHKKLFIEQLLYMDTTEEFSYNAQIEDSQVVSFVTGMAPVLKATTNGYGLWVYRNYVNNCVYNPQFGLGEEGWVFTGNSQVQERNGSMTAMISQNGTISQKLSGRLPAKETLYISFTADSESGASLRVKVGDTEKTVRVSGPSSFSFSIPWQYNHDISFTSDRTVYVDNVQVYTYEQDGRIYDTDGQPLDLAESFRILNEELTK